MPPENDQPARAQDLFVHRHISPHARNRRLAALGVETSEQLLEQALPSNIRQKAPLSLDTCVADNARTEQHCTQALAALAAKNRAHQSFLGGGYAHCHTPAVIRRNVLEDPGWYTPYTPYQPEISQGRLRALLNFQTMIQELTGLAVANASLLDEATACAEAAQVLYAGARGKKNTLLVHQHLFAQTQCVLHTRLTARGQKMVLGLPDTLCQANWQDAFGLLLQLPDSFGEAQRPQILIDTAHRHGVPIIVCADILSLAYLQPPGRWGAQICVGSTQRLGIPLWGGGPHAAFFACTQDYKRLLPGRVIGVSKDSTGQTALRMALQTREQHIRRDKATSNICTAQALLANAAGFFGMYHGRQGLQRIARHAHTLARVFAAGCQKAGARIHTSTFFDTVTATGVEAHSAQRRAYAQGLLICALDEHTVRLTFDETSTVEHVRKLWACMLSEPPAATEMQAQLQAQAATQCEPLAAHRRDDLFMEQDIFTQFRTEHALLRYINRLRNLDIGLTDGMIPLGSCTMKLNAACQMEPVSWPAWADIHPFAPSEDRQGYLQLQQQLCTWLCQITGFAAFSLQPNAGAQGEFAGLLTIKAYHLAQGDTRRQICLIPLSAHGTNPASAVMAGMQVVPVACDAQGEICLDALRTAVAAHKDTLAALMLTYPSTHGVFEANIRDVCQAVHAAGGLIYMDGANMNAQVGLCRPADLGADVCHLNLHKTFCIPHGGGGPGMGPIGVNARLAPFLPGHPFADQQPAQATGAISAAPYGSAGILPISWMYIACMGDTGLTQATTWAIINANYMCARLQEHYPLLYTNANGRVAHEFILDLRPFKASAGIQAQDVAKRLMDYGLHAPTMSFPVAGTLMIEPTESEDLAELDRYCDALIHIRQEIAAIERGEADREDNVLKRAPFPCDYVCADTWPHSFTRQQAAFPLPSLRWHKKWPACARIDDAAGDRNLICSCDGMDAYGKQLAT